MKILYLVLLFLLRFWCVSSVVQQCSVYQAASKQMTQTIYETIYKICGGNNNGICSEIKSTTLTYTVYFATFQCCEGYTEDDCTAYCSFECSVNSECSLPEICTCIDGWEGIDCLIDINECTSNTDLCEYHNTCVNTPGSYTCGCNNNQNLAIDGRRCLDHVSDLTLKPGKRTIKLEFTIPESFYEDGQLEGFHAYCTSQSLYVEENFLGNETVLNIVELFPYTTYICCVGSVWIENGQGPDLCQEIDTLQDVPDVPQNVTIETTSERSALINWDKPNTLNGVLTHYRLYFNYTNSTPIHYIDVSPVSTFFLHEYLHPHQTVGVSVSAATVGGEGSTSMYKFTTTNQDEPGAVDDLTVEVLALFAANITWLPPKALNGIIIKYNLNVTKEISANEHIVFYSIELDPFEELHVTLNSLEPYIPYTVSVAASTIIGLGEIFPATFFTAQLSPSVSPNVAVSRNLPTLITILWPPLSLFELRGFLSIYQVVLGESIEQCSSTTNDKTFDTTQLSINLSVDSLKDYCISVSASTHVGFGERSDPLFLEAYENSVFELHYKGIGDCRIWRENEHGHKIEAVLESIINVLQSYCLCDIQMSYFGDTQFVCNEIDENRVIFQAQVVGTVQTDSKTLVDFLQLWIMTAPTVVIQEELFTLDTTCQVAIDGFNNTSDCVIFSDGGQATETVTADAILSTEGIINVALGLGVLLCLILIVLLVAAICIAKKRNKQRNKGAKNQQSIINRPVSIHSDNEVLVLADEIAADMNSTTESRSIHSERIVAYELADIDNNNNNKSNLLY